MVQFAQQPRSRIQAFAGEIKPVAMALGLVFGLGVGVAPAASAATITVNNLSGTSVGGQCTLRDALLAADTNTAVQGCAAGSGADTINFSVTGTISLATQLTVNSDVTISGPGAANLTLAPSSTNRALYVQNVNTVSISGVTFQGNGTANVDGAAIYNYGGALTIQNSVFSGNVTTGKGGAIYNYDGNVVIQSSTFSGNIASGLGGAIYNYSGTISIDASTFSGNQSASGGGAIALYQDTSTPSSSLTITNSTFSGNQTTGANNDGGAIFLHHSAASKITNSTISGNSSSGSGGAIVLYYTTLAVSNSTITGNTATSSGGGIYLYGSTLNLFSTIVANNVNAGAPDIGVGETGTVNGTNSLVRSTTGFSFSTNVNNITGQDPLLGPLANNGGTTLTHALLGGSPAIDKGINPLALAFDQRGSPFARSSGVTDIGAYEVQGAPPPPPVASTPVPTLSQWGLALLSAMMAGWAMLTGFGKRRRS
jgi:parallel beta-helix repeat protein/predicted outer membrane repeat protein